MPAGFQSWVNGKTVVQIDQDTTALQFRSKSTISAHFSVDAWVRTFRKTLTLPLPIIALRSLSQPVSMLAIKNISGTNYAYFIGPLGTYSFDVYEFAEAASTPSGQGLQVFRADGSLSFSSFAPPMNMVGVYTGITQTTTIVVQPSGKSYAVIPMKRLQQFQYTSGIVQRYTGGARISSSSVLVEPFQTIETGSVEPDAGPNQFYSKEGSYAVVDVTGL